MADAALTKRGPTALAVPSFIKQDDARGKELITANDIRPPALKLAQATTPEAKRADPAYIDGLREGDLFNSITREIYGDAAVHLLFIEYLGHRNTQFDPNDRNVVLEGGIPDDDPRCHFTKNDEGKSVKPAATRFEDYLVLVLMDGRDPQVMTLSLKSTQLKKATKLNTIFKLSKLASFAHLIKATPAPEHRGANSWYGWRFDIVGFPTEAQYLEAEKRFNELHGKRIEVADDTPDVPVADEDIPF